MADLNTYLDKRGIITEQMDEARQETQAVIDAYSLKEARKASNMTQVQVAEAIGVSQNRVSRMENGDMDAMSMSANCFCVKPFSLRCRRMSSPVCIEALYDDIVSPTLNQYNAIPFYTSKQYRNINLLE